MTTGTPVSVEDYLRNSYEPNCEYIDGLLVPKAMGTKKHGRLQHRIAILIETAFPHYETTPEFTVRISEGKYLVPDVSVELRDNSQDPYAVLPIHLCIEILSPDDRLKAVLTKCEDYHTWGTIHTWVIDPVNQKAWQYTKGDEPREVRELRAGDIHLQVSDLFGAN